MRGLRLINRYSDIVFSILFIGFYIWFINGLS